MNFYILESFVTDVRYNFINTERENVGVTLEGQSRSSAMALLDGSSVTAC